jgi:type II secretory pathway pseudopilin PulG
MRPPPTAKRQPAGRAGSNVGDESSRARPNRDGTTLAELIIALMLLGAATAVMLPLMVSVAAQRRAAEQRQLALFAAENLLDDLAATPWGELTQEALSQRLARGDETAAPRTLPGLDRQVTVIDRPDESARQITVQLRWKNRAGDFTTPVRLSAWRFAPLEKSP